MMKFAKIAVISAILATASASSIATVTVEKTVVESAAELPQTVFTLKNSPSNILFADNKAFITITALLSENIASLLTNYEISDPSTQRRLLEIQRSIALVEERWEDALALSPQIRALHSKPTEIAWSGILEDTFATAAKDTGASSGVKFRDTFRRLYEARIQSLDYSLVGDEIESLRGRASILTRAFLQGQVQGSVDPTAAAQANKVNRDFLASLVSIKLTAMLVEAFPEVADVLDARIQTMAKPKEDRWTPRLVNLDKESDLTPVVVGVWDSGLDLTLFEDRLWRNQNEMANGLDDDGNGYIDDLHGIAFDANNTPTTAALRPMEDVRNLNELLDLVKGFLDVKAAVSSKEADLLRNTIRGLPPEEVTSFMLELTKAVLYLHGTAITDIAVANNPAARIVYGRFDYPITAVPVVETEADIDAQVRRIHETVDYLARAGARVINMSFVYNFADFETGLQQSIPDPQERRKIALARWHRMAVAFESAFNRYPEILFFAGAGNDDADVDYGKSLPAGINTPNLVTVGAVDISLKPAGFTAFGESVDLYANGFEVPARVPGGKVIAASGTSQASPAVANLAAKLWAIAPELTMSEVRAIIESTATDEGLLNLKVINPQAAIARVRNAVKTSR